MDAFDKLAKLAGASVESVGEGLPRTKKEAKALGVTRYFTGKPCKSGHVAERVAPWGHCCVCSRQRDATPERRERERRRNATPARKEYMRQRNATPEKKERKRRYRALPKYKDYDRQRALLQTGDAVLFAINQAWWAACHGRSPADIIHQCPEPQRSQLQALVDRIKVDPQAGKSVVGLLRTMRELRKVELAELAAA